MKKLYAILLACAMTISLAACSGGSPASQSASTPSSSQAASSQAAAPSSSAVALPESSGAATSSESASSEFSEPESESAAASSKSASSQPDEEQPTAPAESTPGSEPAIEEESNMSLVVYFSWSGNTRTVAEKIREQTGAEIFEITTVNGYSTDYDTVLDEARAEQSANARPELGAHVGNLSDYDVIYLGYPNWWGDMPMAIYSFLEEYDLSGKIIVPFVTSGGSGFSSTISTIQSAQPNATVVDGLSLSGSGIDGSDAQISQWLNSLGLVG